jgi:hypothetical protein
MSLDVGLPAINFGANAFEKLPLLNESEKLDEQVDADKIRKECTRRSICLPTKTNKADRIKHLRAYDKLQEAYLTAMGRTLPYQLGSNKPRRTASCAFRLLNILFSDKLSDDFAQTGQLCFLTTIIFNLTFD